MNIGAEINKIQKNRKMVPSSFFRNENKIGRMLGIVTEKEKADSKFEKRINKRRWLLTL